MDVKKKKIIFYIGSLGRGGAERVVVNLAEYFQTEGYQVVIATKEQEKEEYPIPSGVSRLLVDISDEEISGNRIRNFIKRIKRLNSTWKKEQPDLIVSFIKKNNLMAILSSRGLYVPVLVAIRSAAFREYPGLYKYIARILFRKAEGVIVQTSEQAEYFGKRIYKKATILPNAINANFIGKVYDGYRKNEIVTVGRIDDNKNQKMLVEAFSLIAAKFPSTQVIIYGDGEGKTKLEQLIQEKKLGNRVLLAGHQTDIKSKIEKARIFVLTSRVEGMPNAMIEAMALGLVPISTDFGGGGVKQLIQDGKNGYIVAVDDVKALSEKIEMVLTDEKLEESLRKNAIVVQEKLNPDIVYSQWKDYFEKFIKKHG